MFFRSRARVLLWSRPRLTKIGYTGRFTSWNSPRMQRLQSVCALDNCNVRCHHDMIYYYYYYYLIGVSRKSFPKKEAKINAYNGSLYFVVPALGCDYNLCLRSAASGYVPRKNVELKNFPSRTKNNVYNGNFIFCCACIEVWLHLCLRSAVPLGDGKTSWAFKSGDSDTALKAGDSIGICFDQVTFCIKEQRIFVL